MKWIIILLISLINNEIVTAARKSGQYYAKRQQNQHSNISKLLDKLLENYVISVFSVESVNNHLNHF